MMPPSLVQSITDSSETSASDAAVEAALARASVTASLAGTSTGPLQALSPSAAAIAAAVLPNKNALLESLVFQEREHQRRQQQALVAAQLAGLAAVRSGPLDSLVAQQGHSNLASRLSADFVMDRLSGLGGSAGLGDISTALLTQSMQTPSSLTPQSPTLLAQAALRSSSMQQAEELLLQSSENGIPRKGRSGTFPQKLHQMLTDLEKDDEGRGIASFVLHGRAFAIHKPKEFVKKIMPNYFRMSRFSSFQRQLNLYEFQRVTEGQDKGSYFHELFMRGHPLLATRIKRNKIKGAAAGVKPVSHLSLVGSDTAGLLGLSEAISSQQAVGRVAGGTLPFLGAL